MHNVVLAEAVRATNLTNVLVMLMLASAVWIAIGDTVHRAIGLLIVQSLGLAALALVTAIVSGVHEVYLSVVITLGGKAILLPWVMSRVMKRSKTDADDAGRMYLGPRTVFIVALALALLSFGVIPPLTVPGTRITGLYLPASVALILIGSLTMTVRKKALIQVIGLVVVENGIYMGAMALTYGLPPVVELGIAFDLFVTVLLLGSLVFHIGEVAETHDTSTLRQLRH